MNANKAQLGLVLIITMTLLLLLALLATSSLSQKHIASHLLRYYQQSIVTQRAAQNTINYLLADSKYFIDYPSYWDAEGNLIAKVPSYLSTESVSVTVSQAVCLLEIQRSDCAEDDSEYCLSVYYWELTASAIDSSSTAQSSVTQGFRLDYLPGFCLNPQFCTGEDCDSGYREENGALLALQVEPASQADKGAVTKLWWHSD